MPQGITSGQQLRFDGVTGYFNEVMLVMGEKLAGPDVMAGLRRLG